MVMLHLMNTKQCGNPRLFAASATVKKQWEQFWFWSKTKRSGNHEIYSQV
jgi:hypothetical protein